MTLRRWLSLLVLCVVIVAAWLIWRARAATAGNAPPAGLVSLLSEPAPEQFARATEPNVVVFPRDFGPHDDYQTEWWYYTGNLATAEGREFGFQFTIFRRAIAPVQEGALPAEPSAWRTNQIYLAHFAVSDIAAGRFYFDERYSRGAAGLAGAQAEPYRVWVEDWFVEATSQDGAQLGPKRLQAATDAYALDLTITQTLPPILHGQGGLSPKSDAPGNASYYYSLLQQRAEGTVTIGEQTFAVTGRVWKDHEYSTSVLGEGAVGWDWLSLQFEDGGALMLFQIRRADGSLEPAGSGTLVDPDGRTRALSQSDWTLTTGATWRSPQTGAVYPIEWTLVAPGLDLTLTGQAKMPNQELTLTAGAYWEGAVRFSGRLGDRPIAAAGYIEMTGYAENSLRP